MTQAFYTSMSGINTAQTQVSVVANNIANINSVGFKASNVTFSDILYNTTSAGSGAAPTRAIGGTNPQQIGIGSKVSAISTIFTNGTFQSTGRTTDLFIQGGGFFTVLNPQNELCYTRAGNFTVDGYGNLVTPTGCKVLGTDNMLGTHSSITPLKIPVMMESKTVPNTDNLAIKNLDLLNGVNIKPGVFFADITYNTASGTDIMSNIRIDMSAATNMNQIATAIEAALKGAGTAGTDFDPANIVVKCDNTTDGKLIIQGLNGSVAEGIAAINFKTSSPIEMGTTNFLSEIEIDSQGTDALGNTTYATKVLDSKQLIDVPGDLSSSLKYTGVNFYDNGELEVTYSNGDKLSVKIDPVTNRPVLKYRTASGIEITGADVVANPQVVVPANLQLQLANFINPNGLLAKGNSIYQVAPNCGQAFYGAPSEGTLGILTPGGLESSNVDMAKQFVDMITAQRAIEANSRVFDTTNQILKSLSYLGN